MALHQRRAREVDEDVIACDELGELRIVNAAARGLGAGEPLALGDRAGGARALLFGLAVVSERADESRPP
jgi:hypothetical protein